MRISDFTPPLPFVIADAHVPPPPPPPMPEEKPTAFSINQLLDRSMIAMNRKLERLLNIRPNAEKVAHDLLAGSTAEQSMAEFEEVVQARRARHQMWAQQVRVCCSVLKTCSKELSPEQLGHIHTEQDRILRNLSLFAPLEISDAFDAIINSPNDFFDKLLELIELIKNGYLAGYEHIIKAYSDFFAAFNEKITAKMKEWIESGNDGKDVSLNVRELKQALDALIKEFGHPNPASVLFPAPGMAGATKEEAEKWRLALGLPESCLKKNADGTYCVVIDLTPLTIMVTSLPENGHEWVQMDNAKYQAWQTGFNAQEERLKNMLQSLTQKYSNANSYHDNFNKTLSSHLNQFADMLKAMLNF